MPTINLGNGHTATIIETVNVATTAEGPIVDLGASWSGDWAVVNGEADLTTSGAVFAITEVTPEVLDAPILLPHDRTQTSVGVFTFESFVGVWNEDDGQVLIAYPGRIGQSLFGWSTGPWLPEYNPNRIDPFDYGAHPDYATTFHMYCKFPNPPTQSPECRFESWYFPVHGYYNKCIETEILTTTSNDAVFNVPAGTPIEVFKAMAYLPVDHVDWISPSFWEEFRSTYTSSGIHASDMDNTKYRFTKGASIYPQADDDYGDMYELWRATVISPQQLVTGITYLVAIDVDISSATLPINNLCGSNEWHYEELGVCLPNFSDIDSPTPSINVTLTNGHTITVFKTHNTYTVTGNESLVEEISQAVLGNWVLVSGNGDTTHSGNAFYVANSLVNAPANQWLVVVDLDVAGRYPPYPPVDYSLIPEDIRSQLSANTLLYYKEVATGAVVIANNLTTPPTRMVKPVITYPDGTTFEGLYGSAFNVPNDLDEEALWVDQDISFINDAPFITSISTNGTFTSITPLSTIDYTSNATSNNEMYVTVKNGDIHIYVTYSDGTYRAECPVTIYKILPLVCDASAWLDTGIGLCTPFAIDFSEDGITGGEGGSYAGGVPGVGGTATEGVVLWDQAGNIQFTSADVTWSLLGSFIAPANQIASWTIPHMNTRIAIRYMIDQAPPDEEGYVHTLSITSNTLTATPPVADGTVRTGIVVLGR